MNKKIGIFALALVLIAILFSGCTPIEEREDVNALIDAKVATANTASAKELSDALDTAKEENEKAINKALEDAKTDADAALATVQSDLDTINAELEAFRAEAEAERIANEKRQTELAVYKIDDVGLTGNFAAVIDSDDYDKLKFYSVRFSGDYFDVEESIVITSDVKPVYNINDEGTSIFLGIGSKRAVEYRVEFPEAIDFTEANEDEDDELEVSFLGKDVVISKFENGDLTFYQGTSKFIMVGDSFTVGDLIIELISVGNDKALIKIGEDAAVIYDGRTKIISDVEVKVTDVLSNEDGPGYAKITVAIENDVEYTVKDGDEYDADNRFEWIVEPKTGNNLEAFGLRLADKYTKDDEVFALGEGISFPNDYIKVTFDSVLNAEVEDLSFRLSSDEIDLIYDGKIEFDGARVERDSVVFNVASATALTFEYETKTDKYEDVPVSELYKLVIFRDDREFNILLTDKAISVTDGTKEYKFKYVGGSDEEFTEAKKDAVIMDDDDDKLVNNGDVVYSSDVTDTSEKEDTVVIGLVGDEDVELVLRVE